jgi:hypothetical protein
MKVRVQVASPETRLWQFSAVAATAQSVSALTRKPGSRCAMASPPDLMTASSGTGGRTPCPQRASSPAVMSTAEPYRNECRPDSRSRTTIIGRMNREQQDHHEEEQHLEQGERIRAAPSAAKAVRARDRAPGRPA